jgi:ribosomal protein L34E
MNKATTKGYKRSRQTAWCCGNNYQRWRFIGAAFPSTGKTHCDTCGKPLNFIKRQSINEIEMSAYFRKRAERLEQGLTCHGTQPKRRNFNINTPLERAWKGLRSTFAATRTDWDSIPSQLERGA